MRTRLALLSLMVLCVSTGCRTFDPPPAELVELFPRHNTHEDIRQNGEVDVESAQLGGTFTARITARRRSIPRVRLELKNDRGTALDLAASRFRVTGYVAGGDAVDASLLELDPPDTNPLVMLGVGLLESAVPVTAERLRGARRIADGWEVDLATVCPHATMVATVDFDGNVIERRFSIGNTEWTVIRDDELIEIRGRGFYMRARLEPPVIVAELPEMSFEIDLPQLAPQGGS